MKVSKEIAQKLIDMVGTITQFEDFTLDWPQDCIFEINKYQDSVLIHFTSNPPKVTAKRFFLNFTGTIKKITVSPLNINISIKGLPDVTIEYES